MNSEQAYQILREIVYSMDVNGEKVRALPSHPDPDALLEASGVDLFAFSEIVEELKQRFHGKDFNLDQFLVPEEFHYLTIGKVLSQLTGQSTAAKRDLEVVYVDDEEENLFIFKRKFAKELNLKTFTEPITALDYIRTHSEVGLVITDEVMPRLSGNELCDEVRKTKPNMKFILITGNPNQDDDLLYRSLKQNRFYEFINKPMNLEKQGAEYLSMIKHLLESN